MAFAIGILTLVFVSCVVFVGGKFLAKKNLVKSVVFIVLIILVIFSTVSVIGRNTAPTNQIVASTNQEQVQCAKNLIEQLVQEGHIHPRSSSSLSQSEIAQLSILETKANELLDKGTNAFSREKACTILLLKAAVVKYDLETATKAYLLCQVLR